VVEKFRPVLLRRRETRLAALKTSALDSRPLPSKLLFPGVFLLSLFSISCVSRFLPPESEFTYVEIQPRQAPFFGFFLPPENKQPRHCATMLLMVRRTVLYFNHAPCGPSPRSHYSFPPAVQSLREGVKPGPHPETISSPGTPRKFGVELPSPR